MITGGLVDSLQRKGQGNDMSDRHLPKHEMRPPARKWLVGIWVLSTVLGTTVWWAGLAWAATWLTQRAVS
jgi:hypothetical protein